MVSFDNLEALVGKYVNQYFYTDIEPVGKIVGFKGKTTIIIKKMYAGDNKTKMEFISGGFAGVCTNQYSQEYDFFELEETITMRVGKSFRKQYGIDEKPRKYYDYNF
jgi:hypothetical protein